MSFMLNKTKSLSYVLHVFTYLLASMLMVSTVHAGTYTCPKLKEGQSYVRNQTIGDSKWIASLSLDKDKIKKTTRMDPKKWGDKTGHYLTTSPGNPQRVTILYCAKDGYNYFYAKRTLSGHRKCKANLSKQMFDCD